MHHDITVVHEHPAGLLVSLHAILPEPPLLGIDDKAVSYGLDMSAGSTAGNNEIVRDERPPADLDDLDVLRFLVAKDVLDYL